MSFAVENPERHSGRVVATRIAWLCASSRGRAAHVALPARREGAWQPAL